MLLDLIGTNFKITNAKPTLCLCTHKTARSKQMPKHFLPNISKYNRLSSFYQLHKKNNILLPKEKHLKTTHILVIKREILCLSHWEYRVCPGTRVYISFCVILWELNYNLVESPAGVLTNSSRRGEILCIKKPLRRQHYIWLMTL